eukprot:jgi/Mesvir1/13878/Mv16015-RA.1
MYEREAEAGCTAAMAALASIYVSGEGVALELTRGIAWARRCIQECPAPEYRVLGLPDPSGPKCQGLLGTAYYNGYGGLDVDLVKAERSWRAAADEGVASSMVALAGLLEEQGRPPEDYAVWYRLAAEHGHPYAMLALSQLLLKGSGCARDSNEGMAWLHMAADAGEVLAVKALADVANHLPGTAGMGMLEAARRHVQAWRAREEGSKEGVQGRTLAMEAGICLDMQRARDAAKSRDELLDELKAAGDAPPSFTDYLGARPMSVELAVKYLDELRGRLGRHCPLTELEREAALLAERAGKMGPSLKSMSSESGAPSMLEAVTPALVSLGTLFAGKGMGDEAHTRFFLPAAKMGDPQACHLAGRYLAKRGASGKDLRMAQRFLSQAAARDVAGAQDELDKLTRRLARGDVGSAEDNDDASGGQECRATSASTAPGTSSMSTANQGTASGSGKSGGSKAAGSTVARGASAECNDVPDGSSKGHRNSGDVNVDQGEESAERGLPPFGKQLAELQDLLKSMQPHVGANSRLIPGGLPVHLPMLEDYVQGHRGSYTGWGMLYSVRHYGGLLLALERADYAPAVTQMCHACLFDEKGPGIPTMIDPRTGQLVPESSFQALFDLVDRVLEKGSPPASSSHNTSGASVHAANRGGGGGQHASGPSSAPSASSLFFEAAVVKLSMAMTAQDGLRFSDRALKAAPPRMVPAMLSRRAIFHSNRRKSLADLEAAAKLLRADGSTSLWPYDPPELAGSSGEMAKFREIMACTLEVNMAHCWHDHPANMVTHLMRFQRGVPEDTDGLPKSYFTLCQALISLGPDRRGAEAVYKHLQSLLDEADRLTPLRVPVLQPFRAEVSPSFRELRETVSMLVQVRRQGGAGMAQSATASRLELMAQGQGRDGSAAGQEWHPCSGVVGAGWRGTARGNARRSTGRRGTRRHARSWRREGWLAGHADQAPLCIFTTLYYH